ncbi:MAG TPA: VgrG-related protein [Acidimicrobiales bacterium]|nr:VgrG-related protein [Acidimicrobiales bacterium]
MTDTIRYLPDAGIPAPIIKVNGADLSNAARRDLVHLSVELSGHEPAAATLRFLDDELEHIGSTTFALGAEIKVEVSEHSERSIGTGLVFTGEIVVISLDDTGDRVPELVVEAVDHRHRLTYLRSTATHLNQTSADIIAAIVGDAGLSLDRSGLPPLLSVQREHVVTTGSSFDVIDRLVTEAGGEWWCDGTTVHVAKRSAANAGPTATWRRTLRSISMRQSSLGRFSSIQVRGWDQAQKRALVGTATTSDGFSEVQLDARLVSGLGHASAPLVTHRYPVRSQNEADATAKAIAARMASTAKVLRGELVAAEATLRPGGTITIEGVGDKINGTYVVGSVQHVFGDDGFVSRFETAGPASSVDIGVAPVPAAPHQGAHWPELAIGIVTNIKDPKNLGRVKLKLPVLGDEVETDWARVASPFAGPKRGFGFLPEVNDEVLVGFEAGDPGRPVVLGSLWNDKDKPDTSVRVQGSAIHERGITSRLGHTLMFGDGDGDTAKHIALMLTGDKHKLRLGNDRFDVEMPSGKPIVLKAGSTNVTIDDKGNVTIEGADIKIKAKGALSLEGSTVAIKAQSSLKLEGAQVEAKAQATVTVQSSGPAAVKGNPVQIN